MAIFKVKKETQPVANKGDEEIVFEQATDPAVAILTQQVKDLTSAVTGLSEQNKALSAKVEQNNSITKVLNYAKTMGATDKEANELAMNDSKTYEEKLESCLKIAADFKKNVKGALDQSTAPVGDLTTDALTDEGAPKNSKEAIKAIEKTFAVKGNEAYQKAKLVYPEVFEARFNKVKK